jgi:hypothetical protein
MPEGQSASAAADRALASQGAKKAPPQPPQSNAYSFTGLHWEVLPVSQNYNPAGERTSGGQTALTNTYPDWSGVSGSSYRIQFGSITNRCPSLVKECPGRRRTTGSTTSAGRRWPTGRSA